MKKQQVLFAELFWKTRLAHLLDWRNSIFSDANGNSEKVARLAQEAGYPPAFVDACAATMDFMNLFQIQPKVLIEQGGEKMKRISKFITDIFPTINALERVFGCKFFSIGNPKKPVLFTDALLMELDEISDFRMTISMGEFELLLDVVVDNQNKRLGTMVTYKLLHSETRQQLLSATAERGDAIGSPDDRYQKALTNVFSDLFETTAVDGNIFHAVQQYLDQNGGLMPLIPELSNWKFSSYKGDKEFAKVHGFITSAYAILSKKMGQELPVPGLTGSMPLASKDIPSKDTSRSLFEKLQYWNECQSFGDGWSTSYKIVPGVPATKVYNILYLAYPDDDEWFLNFFQQLGYSGSLLVRDNYGNGKLLETGQIDLMIDYGRGEANWLSKCRKAAHSSDAPVAYEFLRGHHFSADCSDFKEKLNAFLAESLPLKPISEVEVVVGNLRPLTLKEMGWMATNLASTMNWSDDTRKFLSNTYLLPIEADRHWESEGLRYPNSGNVLQIGNNKKPASIADILSIFIRVDQTGTSIFQRDGHGEESPELTVALNEIEFVLQQLGYLQKPLIDRGISQTIIPGQKLDDETIKACLQWSGEKFRSIKVLFDGDYVELQSLGYVEGMTKKCNSGFSRFNLEEMDKAWQGHPEAAAWQEDYSFRNGYSGITDGKTLEQEVRGNSWGYIEFAKNMRRVRVSRAVVERYLWIEEFERVPHLAYAKLFHENGYYGCARIPIDVIWY